MQPARSNRHRYKRCIARHRGIERIDGAGGVDIALFKRCLLLGEGQNHRLHIVNRLSGGGKMIAPHQLAQPTSGVERNLLALPPPMSLIADAPEATSQVYF